MVNYLQVGAIFAAPRGHDEGQNGIAIRLGLWVGSKRGEVDFEDWRGTIDWWGMEIFPRCGHSKAWVADH